MLFDLNSEINAIQPTFAKKLGLFIRLIDVKAQKIDGTILNTYKMVIATFLMANKANQVIFFKKLF